MGQVTKRGECIFCAKCAKRGNSLEITIPKKQIVDFYKLKPGDLIWMKYIRKVEEVKE